MKRNRSYQDDEDEYEPPTKKTTRKTTKKTPKKAPSLRVTRLMKVDASRRAVFETVELLENILEQLPPREIIVCERVCKQFQRVIKSSLKMQRILFRTVDDVGEKWTVREEFSLEGDITGLYHFEPAPTSQKHQDGTSTTYRACRLNTTFFEHSFSDVDQPNKIPNAAQVHVTGSTTVNFRPEISHILMDMVRGKSGSWGDMYITSPPCQQVRISVRIKFSPTQSCQVVKNIIASSGITLGELASQLSASTGRDDFGLGNSRQQMTRRSGWNLWLDCSGGSLKDYVASVKSKTGRDTGIVSGPHGPWLKLDGVVLPTEEEREAVRGRASESEV